jgi:hypothetical protein
MASEYPNSGILFKNHDRKTDKHPTHRGDANLTCAHCSAVNEVWLSGWIKEGRKGKFLSLSFRSKQDSQPAARQQEEEDIP